ncbi:MAG: putative selenium-dependent hydroxylase accessory protein YqeC [Anaerolineae bacterium]|nr:putative selenium-dependent hydroxylase accessory protein YqeC [Anaerolineae bacterium]
MKLSQALRLTSGSVIALTGGGGKTTAMFRLADELANHSPQKMGVLTTTSTHIFSDQTQHAPAHVVFEPTQESIADILPRLAAAVAEHGHILLTRPINPVTSKAPGIPPPVIDTLMDTGHFEVIIVEADGARCRPFKAPAAHEPVVPASATVVVPVVGLDVVGQPLNEQNVHRPDLVGALSGTEPDEPVTIDTIAAVLGHSEGGLKNVPSHARVVPLLNKAENPARMAAAQELAAKLLDCEQIDSVLLGSVQTAKNPVIEAHGRIAAIVLAAGGSTRFGSPKQLARWGQQSFIEQVVEVALASQAHPVVVVLGAEAGQCRAAIGNRAVTVMVNAAWAEGQGTSVKAGLAALPANVVGAVFLLVDLPGVTSEVVDALIWRHRQTLAPIIWPEFAGKRGNPILFDRNLFDQLREISGDTGGRPLVLAYQDQAERVAVTNRAILQDIDRPEDLLVLGTDE